MITKRWDFRDEDLHRYSLVLNVGNLWHERVVTVNAREVVRGGGRLRTTGEHRFEFDGHSAVLTVSSLGFRLNYELRVDGLTVPPEGGVIPRPPAATANQATGTTAPEGGIGERREALLKRVRGGGQWFYWIAALSGFNYLLSVLGTGSGFAVGTVIDWILHGVLEALGASAVVPAAHVAVVLLFVLLGIRATAAVEWAFVVGGIVYAIDGALFLIESPDWIAIAVHAIALFSVVNGWRALRELRALSPQVGSAVTP